MYLFIYGERERERATPYANTCEYHRCYANKIPAEQHVQTWVLFIFSDGQIFLFVISLQPSVMSCTSEGDPGWLSISHGSSKGAKVDAEGKNAEGVEWGIGVHSSCSADFSSSVAYFQTVGRCSNCAVGGRIQRSGGLSRASVARRVVSGAIADARMMATILKEVVRITKALKHKKVGSWHLSNLEEDMFRWRREMSPHPPLQSVRRPLQWCVSIGLSTFVWQDTRSQAAKRSKSDFLFEAGTFLTGRWSWCWLASDASWEDSVGVRKPRVCGCPASGGSLGRFDASSRMMYDIAAGRYHVTHPILFLWNGFGCIPTIFRLIAIQFNVWLFHNQVLTNFFITKSKKSLSTRIFVRAPLGIWYLSA